MRPGTTDGPVRPVGDPVAGWRPPPPPPREPLVGRHCRLEPLDPGVHAAALHVANARDAGGDMWTYLPYGPFVSATDYRRWVEAVCVATDPIFFAIVETARGQPVGVASYLRIQPDAGSVEVGHLAFSPLLQRTTAATEAIHLLMGRAFGLGYRRLEWKCDALNARSRQAAMRLGLSFEGVFRQATVVKGRNRDTAWYAAIDRDWPALHEAFAAWLDAANFDDAGRQRRSLSDLTRPVLVQRG